MLLIIMSHGCCCADACAARMQYAAGHDAARSCKWSSGKPHQMLAKRSVSLRLKPLVDRKSCNEEAQYRQDRRLRMQQAA